MKLQSQTMAEVTETFMDDPRKKGDKWEKIKRFFSDELRQWIAFDDWSSVTGRNGTSGALDETRCREQGEDDYRCGRDDFAQDPSELDDSLYSLFLFILHTYY